MERVYRSRRECLVTALKDAFGDRVSILGAAAGLHIVAAFQGIAFSKETLGKLKDAGVIVYPVEEHCIQKGLHTDQVIMGYGNLDEMHIKQGIVWLKEALGQAGSLN